MLPHKNFNLCDQFTSFVDQLPYLTTHASKFETIAYTRISRAIFNIRLNFNSHRACVIYRTNPVWLCSHTAINHIYLDGSWSKTHPLKSILTHRNCNTLSWDEARLSKNYNNAQAPILRFIGG